MAARVGVEPTGLNGPLVFGTRLRSHSQSLPYGEEGGT